MTPFEILDSWIQDRGECLAALRVSHHTLFAGVLTINNVRQHSDLGTVVELSSSLSAMYSGKRPSQHQVIGTLLSWARTGFPA